jgi:hypothetical protein
MDSAAKILQGFQLSLVPQVESYWVENERSSSPEQQFKVGDKVRLRAGQFCHREVVAVEGEIIYIERDRYRVQCGSHDRWGGWYGEIALERVPVPQPPSKKQRRHSQKGRASGWIEERIANPQRKHPTTCYFYCWTEPDQDGQQRKQKQYVQAHLMAAVRSLVEQRQPAAEILQHLNQNRKPRHI